MKLERRSVAGTLQQIGDYLKLTASLASELNELWIVKGVMFESFDGRLIITVVLKTAARFFTFGFAKWFIEIAAEEIVKNRLSDGVDFELRVV